jgi:hypothetical protein
MGMEGEQLPGYAYFSLYTGSDGAVSGEGGRKGGGVELEGQFRGVFENWLNLGY